MLQIEVPAAELYDEERNLFITTKPVTLHLEHSLVAISKWEEKWKIPFFKPNAIRTNEQSKHYIKCMTLDQNVDLDVYEVLTKKHFDIINAYIEEDRTATWFSETNQPRSRDIITSELIYYWMVANQIPWEAQNWHISRLLTLIRICNVYNQPQKKMNKRDILSRNKSLNAARRAKLHTKG